LGVVQAGEAGDDALVSEEVAESEVIGLLNGCLSSAGLIDCPLEAPL
jgi:hypothetical protein